MAPSSPGTHGYPEIVADHKGTISGVAFSAAKIRSPSFAVFVVDDDGTALPAAMRQPPLDESNLVIFAYLALSRPGRAKPACSIRYEPLSQAVLP